jgi:hypothetical protein
MQESDQWGVGNAASQVSSHMPACLRDMFSDRKWHCYVGKPGRYFCRDEGLAVKVDNVQTDHEIASCQARIAGIE